MNDASPIDAVRSITAAFGLKCSFVSFDVRNLKKMYQMTIQPEIICPIIVAAAAPAIPQPKPNTKSASSPVFITAPMMLQNIMGLPLLSWLAAALAADGCGRFFFICPEKYRAAAEGCVTERNCERCENTEALRLCFETEHAGEKLLVTAFFDASDKPLYAEIEQDGRILAYLQFTDFVFCDIIPSD